LIISDGWILIIGSRCSLHWPLGWCFEVGDWCRCCRGDFGSGYQPSCRLQ